MVKIRLKRTGTRNRACFRVVVMDARASRDGKSIEERKRERRRSTLEQTPVHLIDDLSDTNE